MERDKREENNIKGKIVGKGKREKILNNIKREKEIIREISGVGLKVDLEIVSLRVN